MKIKKHSFRLLENDEDIEKVLVKLDGQKKSNFIREALKCYIAYEDRLKSIEDKLKLILQSVDNKQIKQDKNVTEPVIEEQKEPLSEAEKFLANSIQNLLDI